MDAWSIISSLAVTVLAGLLGFYIQKSAGLKDRIVRSITIALPTIFLFLLFMGQRNQAKDLLDDVTSSLEEHRAQLNALIASQNTVIQDLARAFTFEVVEGSENCERVTVSIASNADEFLYATGSLSRSQRYLEAIEERLHGDSSISYKRVVWGDRYSQAFRTHVVRIGKLPVDAIRRSHFYYSNRASSAFVVISDKELFIMLPGRRRSQLDMGLRTTNSRRIQEYYQYFNDELITDAIEIVPAFKLFDDRLRESD